MFGYLFVDAQNLIGQAYLDETRRPQGKSFLEGADDALNYCLGWDSLYTRGKIPLGEGAVIKDGGTEQFNSFLLVGPAKGLSLAISATSDGDVWWLELLEEGKLTRDQVLVRRFELLFGELGLSRPAGRICLQYEEYLKQGHWFVPGAQALLAELSPRYGLYLASNGSAAVQHSRLDSAGIRPYFRDIFISEEMGADKPGLAFFEACFARIPGFSRETALMVGDSLTSDIRGGRNAGLRTCWFDPLGKPRRADIVPDCRITALGQLPELLERL